jgi:hypothetical protein
MEAIVLLDMSQCLHLENVYFFLIVRLPVTQNYPNFTLLSIRIIIKFYKKREARPCFQCARPAFAQVKQRLQRSDG